MPTATIRGFAVRDSIDLEDLTFAKCDSASFTPVTRLLTVSAGGHPSIRRRSEFLPRNFHALGRHRQRYPADDRVTSPRADRCRQRRRDERPDLAEQRRDAGDLADERDDPDERGGAV